MKIKVFLLTGLAVLTVQASAMADSGDGYLSSYGRASVEYDRRVQQNGHKFSPSEKAAVANEVFASTKQAYANDVQRSQAQMSELRASMKREIDWGRSGHYSKKAALSDGKLASSAPVDHNARVPAAEAKDNTTGKVGAAGGADKVGFDIPITKDGFYPQ